jgi:hypothetical protein
MRHCLGQRERVSEVFMAEPFPGVNDPEDWIGRTVVVLSEGVCESMLPEGGIPLVAEIYSGELRVVNDVGVSLTLLTSREKDEGAFYLGGDTFFHGTP